MGRCHGKFGNISHRVICKRRTDSTEIIVEPGSSVCARARLAIGRHRVKRGADHLRGVGQCRTCNLIAHNSLEHQRQLASCNERCQGRIVGFRDDKCASDSRHIGFAIQHACKDQPWRQRVGEDQMIGIGERVRGLQDRVGERHDQARLKPLRRIGSLAQLQVGLHDAHKRAGNGGGLADAKHGKSSGYFIGNHTLRAEQSGIVDHIGNEHRQVHGKNRRAVHQRIGQHMENTCQGVKGPIGNATTGTDVHRCAICQSGRQAVGQEHRAEVVAKQMGREPEDQTFTDARVARLPGGRSRF